MNAERIVRVAIVYTSHEPPNELRTALESGGLEIAAVGPLENDFLRHISKLIADIILVDLEEDSEQELGALESLLDTAILPVLFNDRATTQFKISNQRRDWGKKLLKKIHKLVDLHESSTSIALDKPRVLTVENELSVELDENDDNEEVLVIDEIEESAIEATSIVKLKSTPLPLHPHPSIPLEKRESLRPLIYAQTSTVYLTWVIGASLGGPVAVKNFLSALPANLPLGFLLAQHIGAGHIDLLAKQLDRSTELKVVTAINKTVLRNNEVVIVPIDQKLIIDKHRNMTLTSLNEKSIYTPCIDYVMRDVADQFGIHSGAIIFSGMGNDGEVGTKYIAKQGGLIWAQDTASCVISSMPDNARKTGHVSYSGTPEQLAHNLIRHFDL